MDDIPNPPQWKWPCECHDLAEAVLTFNGLYKQVMQGAWTRKIPSPEAMGQLRAARLEMVRQANKHIEQEQHDGG